MVTVVPSFNRGASIGQAIGNGLQGLVPMAQQKYQRSQLQSGLDEALAGMSPEMQKRLGPTINLLRAAGGVPGMERTLSTLLPEVLREQAIQDQRNVPEPGENALIPGDNVPIQQRNALPEFLNRQPQAQRQAQSLQGIQSQGSGSLVPTAIGEGISLGPKYTAQQIFENPRNAEAMRQRNREIEAQEKAEENRAVSHAERAKLRTERQDKQRAFFQSKAADIKGRDFNTLMRIAQKSEIQNLPSDDEQFDKAIREYDRLERDKYRLKNLAVNAYDPERFSENYKSIEGGIKPMIDSGMRDDLEGFLPKELGLGPVNTENLINPTSKGLYQSASDLPSYDQYTRELASLPDYAPNQEYQKLEKQKEKMDNQWRSWLKKNIKPGREDIKDPNGRILGSSLLSARDIADQKGMPWEMFSRMVKDMAAKGELDLDERQRGELLQIAEKPSMLEGWAEMLFGLGSILKVTPKLPKGERRR